MSRLIIVFLLPVINASITVRVYRQALFYPNSSCAFIRNNTLLNDQSMQTCIWQCQDEYDCQTVMYNHEKKICSMYGEDCESGRIVFDGNIQNSVICNQKNHEKSETMQACTSTITTAANAIYLTALNINLVTNGDGESGLCTSLNVSMHPTSWNYSGSVTQVTYNATFPGHLTSTTLGPTNRGRCYFYGYNSSNTSMWQIISLTNPIDLLNINNQTIHYNLSAWLGGYDSQDDHVLVSLTFLNETYHQIGSSVALPTVLANDRGQQTELLFRNVTGLLPISTRFLKVIAYFVFTYGT